MAVIGSNHACLAARSPRNLAVAILNYFNEAGKALKKSKMSPLQRPTTRNGSLLIPAKLAASREFCEHRRLRSHRRAAAPVLLSPKKPPFFAAQQPRSAPAPEGRG